MKFKKTIFILASLLLVLLWNPGWGQDGQMNKRQIKKQMKEMASPVPEEVGAAIIALSAAGEGAIPYLEAGLKDPQLRASCVGVLSRMAPAQSTPVLLEAMESAAEGGRKETPYFRYLVGALGRSGDNSIVPNLEVLYLQETTKDSPKAISLAWALQTLTGEEYEHAHDPWERWR